MRITLVTQHFAPHFEGGTEAVARSQARELARRGHEVAVVSGTDRPHAGEDVEHAEVDGIPVAFLPRLSDESYDLALDRPRLRGLIREHTSDAELVHVHHWSTLTGSLVRDLAAARPVVVTLHDLFVTCPRFFRLPAPPVERCPERGDFEPCARCCAVDAPGWTLPSLEAGLKARASAYRAELDAAARVVAPSRAHAANLRRFVDVVDERLAVVPHGLVHPVTPIANAAWDGTGRLRVLFLGHRSEVKGVLDLLRALAALDPGRRARVELILLGDEVQPGIDGRLAEERGGVRIRFAGDYRPDELTARVREAGGAHLGVFPSRAWESYGLVADELAALGLPVWVSDRGAPAERVGAAGRVLPAADPDAWRKAFCEVLDAPDILECERRALSTARRTAADAAGELDALYRELSPSA